jgi:hypothetical protein
VTKLVLETKTQPDATAIIGPLAMTPPIDDSYWRYRVQVGPGRAVVGFPKHFTIGIGFQEEGEDWNRNLPWTCPTVRIYEHIKLNKGDAEISRETCIEAIELIRAACRQDNAPGGNITEDEHEKMFHHLEELGLLGGEKERD